MNDEAFTLFIAPLKKRHGRFKKGDAPWNKGMSWKEQGINDEERKRRIAILQANSHTRMVIVTSLRIQSQSYKWMNTATDCTGMSQVKPLQENSVSLVAIYETFVMDKGIIVAATGGNGTKDFCRYVVDIAYYIYSFGRLWWKNEPKINFFVKLCKQAIAE